MIFELQSAVSQRWFAMCDRLGIAAEKRDYEGLLRGWRSFGRRYHTLAHLEACLAEFDRVSAVAERPAAVECALWFHDAVYRSWRSDNEARSADWAARVLGERGGDGELIERVRVAILATKHAGPEGATDVGLVVDIDISILGQPPGVYDRFEQAVRCEYGWVPRSRYRQARRAVLRSFLDRPAIYAWPEMRERYEEPARANLARAIAQLEAG
ncbi:MAG: N-methyl-D-aspartate receptor NMDAR2C subunit [Steroidobacteraceae bacterium]